MTRPIVSFALVALILSGCRDKEITSYRAPKDPAPPSMAAAGAQGALPGAETPPSPLRWVKPEGWQEQPGNSVRVATFLCNAPDGRKAELSITQFPGDVGGDLANVNRWRGQIQLPPISEADLSSVIHDQEFPAGSFHRIDMVATTNTTDGKFKDRILGAWTKHDGRTWFFKFRGEEAWLASQAENFDHFLQSLEFIGSAAQPESATPVGMPPSAGAETPPPPSSDATWAAPATWKAKPLGSMRKGSYAVPAADGSESDLSIIVLPGEAGGLLENINRWRGQISLPPLEPTTLTRESSFLVTPGDVRFTIVDFPGTGPKMGSRLLGAIATVDDRSYFIKLTGSDAAATEAKPAFLEFLKTIQIR